VPSIHLTVCRYLRLVPVMVWRWHSWQWARTSREFGHSYGKRVEKPGFQDNGGAGLAPIETSQVFLQAREIFRTRVRDIPAFRRDSDRLRQRSGALRLSFCQPGKVGLLEVHRLGAEWFAQVFQALGDLRLRHSAEEVLGC
jgi:hypothetical protein